MRATTKIKIYANRALFEIFTSVVTRSEGHMTAADVKEAIRIRKRLLNIDNIVALLMLGDDELKDVLGTVRFAEEVAEKTNVVPNLYDL